MAESESDSEPVAGAVFGFTGTVPKNDSSAVKKPRPQHSEISGSADTPKLLQNKSGQNTRRRRQGLRQRALPKELQVKADDVSALSELQSLLVTFNDPYAAGTDLVSHIEEIPLLAGRLIRTARIQTGQMQLNQVSMALSLLGNTALERELLLLLEDMTEVKFDFLDKQDKKK